MDQSLPSGAPTLKAVARRSEVHFEGQLQAGPTTSVAGGVRVVPGSIAGLCAAAMRIASCHQMRVLPIF